MTWEIDVPLRIFLPLFLVLFCFCFFFVCLLYFHIHSNFSAASPFFVCEKLLQCACMNIKSYSAYLVRIAALALLIRLTLTLSTLSFLVFVNPPSFLSLSQSLTLYTLSISIRFRFFSLLCALPCIQIRSLHVYSTFYFAIFYFMHTGNSNCMSVLSCDTMAILIIIIIFGNIKLKIFQITMTTTIRSECVHTYDTYFCIM